MKERQSYLMFTMAKSSHRLSQKQKANHQELFMALQQKKLVKLTKSQNHL